MSAFERSEDEKDRDQLLELGTLLINLKHANVFGIATGEDALRNAFNKTAKRLDARQAEPVE